MQTDLFTVQRDDVIEFVAEMMDWRKIRYMPVEDAQGKLVGLMTSRLVLRHFVKSHKLTTKTQVLVKDVMLDNPTTIKPSATLVEALKIMRDNRLGCLPVVNNENELIGIITEMDFLRISFRLIERIE